MAAVHGFKMQAGEYYDKRICKCTKAYKAKQRRTAAKKVYRDEVRASERYTFFMSNLEGLCVIIQFFVNSLRFRIAVKILIEIVQFPVKVSGFFLGRFIGFL